MFKVITGFTTAGAPAFNPGKLLGRETSYMKVQEYMLQALKDAVQMEVEGRQFYL